MTKKILLWAVLLGAATSVMIGLAETFLPNSGVKGIVIDALALPGAFIAGFYYTEGLHTGRGAPSWGYVVIALNFVVYVLFWLFVFTVAVALANRHKHKSKFPNPSFMIVL